MAHKIDLRATEQQNTNNLTSIYENNSFTDKKNEKLLAVIKEVGKHLERVNKLVELTPTATNQQAANVLTKCIHDMQAAIAPVKLHHEEAAITIASKNHQASKI